MRSAREAMATYLQSEDDRLGYRVNIACVIMDNPQQKDETAHEWRNRVAELILLRVFESLT